MVVSKAMIAWIAALGIGGAAIAGVAVQQGVFSAEPSKDANGVKTIPLRIASSGGSHAFRIERAVTPAEQEKGLMYRTDLKPDGGMLFWPYPADGGGPRVASFWMRNTPTPLDIIFIRPDGTIARIAENTVPFSETPVDSGEPVDAVLELVGGRSAELGIAEGDKVTWAGRN